MKNIQTFEQFSIQNEEINWRKLRNTAMAGAMAIGSIGAHGQDKDIREIDKDPVRIERSVEGDPVQYLKTRLGKKYKVESGWYEQTGFTTFYSGNDESDSKVMIDVFHPNKAKMLAPYYITVHIKGKKPVTFKDLSDKGLKDIVKYLSSNGIGVYGL